MFHQQRAETPLRAHLLYLHSSCASSTQRPVRPHFGRLLLLLPDGDVGGRRYGRGGGAVVGGVVAGGEWRGVLAHA
ncbi:hypothetical protein E2C01_089630 [Portunus trituberculatus]|uniref:Uncharacterized protein n=1 Tax=Portunus trituberculatus TaxID=210409 RepID=A0A5B7JHR9_PORTR|nr:hypothetical protein [Portunus trituberculatus]